MKNRRISKGRVCGKEESYAHVPKITDLLSSASSLLMPRIRTNRFHKEVEYKGQNAVIHLSTALIKRGI